MDNKYKKISDFKGINDYILNKKREYGIPENEDFGQYGVEYYEKRFLAPNSGIVEERIDINNGKVYARETANIVAPQPEEEKPAHIDIFDKTATGKLSRLFDMSGPDYKYNRGIIMIDETGRKEEEILDGTSNHHSDMLAEIATNRFGRNVPYQGPVTELAEGMEAASQGLVTLLLEGKHCIMIIPDDLTVEAIDSIMEEVEPRNNFAFIVSKADGTFTDEITNEILLDYLQGLKEQKEEEIEVEPTPEEEIPEEHDMPDKLSVNEYINSLLRYLEVSGISLLEYYRMIGELYRSGDTDSIPEFELKNPFLDENDIRLLIEKDEDRIVEYFARAMFRVINMNVSKDHKTSVRIAGEYTGNPEIGEKEPIFPDYDTSKEDDGKNSPEENQENSSALAIRPDNITSLAPIKEDEDNKMENDDEKIIDREEISNEIDNLLEKTEEKADYISFDVLDEIDGYAVLRDDEEINIYTYDHNNKEILSNRVIYSASEFNLRSGYYISLKEALNSIIAGNDDIAFINDDNEEFSIDSIYSSIEEYALEKGAIKLQQDNEYTDDIYVNKKDISHILKNFKLKSTTKDNNMSNKEL